MVTRGEIVLTLHVHSPIATKLLLLIITFAFHTSQMELVQNAVGLVDNDHIDVRFLYVINVILV